MRVYLVESHPRVRATLASALTDAPGIRVVGSSGSAAEALRDIPRCLPHLAVVGDRLPDGDQLSVCWALAQAAPRVRVVLHVTSLDDSDSAVTEVIGAEGYVLKQVRPAALVAALHLAFAKVLEDNRRAVGERLARSGEIQERSRSLVSAARGLCAAAQEQREGRARIRARARVD